MAQISPENVWQMSEKELLSLLNANLLSSKRGKIHFYAPSFMYYRTSHYSSSTTNFPTISVTGRGCALKCKHCSGKVLETMYSALTPKELFELSSKLKGEGAYGCLISGGCLPNGSVPLENFVDVIGRVKRDLGLTIFVHTGIIDFSMAKRLKDAGVDAALIDVIGSDETVKEIYNLKITTKDYENSLKALNDVGIVFVPHVIVGLHYGKLKGELHALEIISKYKPSAVVIIAFMPIRGTEMEKIEPPKPMDIARVIGAARLLFPKTPIVLGCMRPKGKHRVETDVLAVKAGVDGIAFPTEEAIKFAGSQGTKIFFSSFCCSQIYMDFYLDSP